MLWALELLLRYPELPMSRKAQYQPQSWSLVKNLGRSVR